MMFDLMKKLEALEIQETKLETQGLETIKPEGTMTFQKCKDFWNDLFSKNMENKGTDIKENYYSTYQERIQQTPKEVTDRGIWENKRGESKFIPSDQYVKDILEQYDLDGIAYQDGIPDFFDCAEASVEIQDMTENRVKNFRQCDEQCAEQWNKELKDNRMDWTPREVAQWREEHNYSWHERNDMKYCDLVPTKINDYFGHLGGVSECKKRDANFEGSVFDA